jgi:hypothetical protein
LFHPYQWGGYLVQQGESLEIPCKPTHPNLNVSVTRTGEITAKGIISTQSDRHDLLSESDSNWLLKYDSGLTLRQAKVIDTGDYTCIGTMNNITDEKRFSIYVKGICLSANYQNMGLDLTMSF